LISRVARQVELASNLVAPKLVSTQSAPASKYATWVAST
jgi:hypothetical protein